MTAPTLTLAEFLLARIAEDEAMARDAADVTAPPWRWQHLPPPLDYGLAGVHPIQGGLSVIVPSRSGDMWPDRDPAAHIARWDPARVRAECEAKRRVVAEHDEAWRRPHRDLSPMNSYIAKGRLNGLWTALQMLALPYANHPDYREDWRP